MDEKPLREMSHEEIKDAVRLKYGEVATKPGSKFGFPVGKAFAVAVGYAEELLDSLPASMSESFTGANNPQPFVDLKPGDVVADIGCGAGLDLYHYSRQVGDSGKVIGVDISEDMVAKARSNMESTGCTNAEVICGTSDHIPIDSESVDVVASNGIYNLSPHKLKVMTEVYRILKPGGRTVFSEIVLRETIVDKDKFQIKDWFRCIGGAMEESEFLRLLSEAGFIKIDILSLHRNARTSHPASVCANIRAYKPH